MTKTRTKPGTEPAQASVDAGAAQTAAAEQMVAAYLRDHPDFFEQNAAVLASLSVPHAPSGSVSLIERQVKVLRRHLEAERSRLAQLIARAREYEALSTRLHVLVLQLIIAPDLKQVGSVLQEALMREFSAQAVMLKLFPLDPVSADAARDPLTAAFKEFLLREHALCGPLDEEKNRLLFGDLGGEVQCAALIPLRGTGCSGVLAIGAADPDRFKPDMRTDLLDRLGEVVSHKLQGLQASSRPRVEPLPDPLKAALPVMPEAPAPKKPRAPRSRKPKVVEDVSSE
ncbi:DUF484 family protein [uncultured Lamprocystis sp.]|jgi:uncharacterized protein YigA (DUF484 family)|uniref:DUF484 family protein n=1 Tax=uncultured Lamprocystis sp. TaxID=543132 RepID=UPI0025CE4A56|nr:DUF484 family protein [uncultured Lamprocystis sp.]